MTVREIQNILSAEVVCGGDMAKTLMTVATQKRCIRDSLYRVKKMSEIGFLFLRFNLGVGY